MKSQSMGAATAIATPIMAYRSIACGRAASLASAAGAAAADAPPPAGSAAVTLEAIPGSSVKRVTLMARRPSGSASRPARSANRR